MIVNGLFNLPNNLSSFIPHFMANRTEAKVQCVSPRGRMGAPVPLGKSFSSPFSWWEHGPLSIGEKVALCDTVAWAAAGNASIPYLTLLSCPSKHLLRVAQDWGLFSCCGCSGEFWAPGCSLQKPQLFPFLFCPCHSAFQINLWERISLPSLKKTIFGERFFFKHFLLLHFMYFLFILCPVSEVFDFLKFEYVTPILRLFWGGI